MDSIFFLLETAPYGRENAYALLNAAVVCLKVARVTVGLYYDGVYLALSGQNGKALGVPDLSSILYAYPDMRVIAHEPSILNRGLMSEGLIETIELMDEEEFLKEMDGSEGLIIL